MSRVCPPAASRLLPALLVAAAVAACSSSQDAPHGAPVLVSVYWNVGGARYTIWSSPAAPDPAQVATVPPLASEIDFVFNRRLDGNRIEDTVTVGGVSVQQSKAVPPITVTGFDPQASTPPFHMDVLYNSAGLFGGQSSYVLARPRVAGFPAGTPLTFHLDRSSLTSPYNEPLAMPDTLDTATGPFAVEVRLPASDAGAPAVTRTFQVPLVFTNRPTNPAGAAAFVHARAGGADLPIDLLADTRDSSSLLMVPAACPGAWPETATVEVTIDPGLPDSFGVPLAAGATATFTTLAGTAPSSCPTPDAGSD